MSVNFSQFPAPKTPLLPGDLVVGYQVRSNVPTLAQYTLTQIASAVASIGGPAGGDLSGTYPNPTVSSVHATSGTLANVTAVTGSRIDNTTLVATDNFVNQQIASSTANVPVVLTGGVYNQASLGTGVSYVIFASGGVISSVITVISGGTGYAVGDLLLVIGGNYDAILRVTNVVGGVVQSGGLAVLYGGTGYSTGATTSAVPVPPGQRTVTATGVLTSNVTFIIQNGTYLTAARRIQFNNNTTGAFTTTIFLSNGAGGTVGSGIVVPQGTNNSSAVLLETDGVNDVWLADTPTGIGAIAQNQLPTGFFYANAGARIDRLNDRVFVGGATVNAGNPSGVGAQDWMEQLRQFSTSISQQATLSTIGQIAVAAGSRTSDSPNAGSMGCIGYESIINNNNSSQVQFAWGSYMEARRQVGCGTTTGLEIDTVNLGATVDLLPYGAQATGITPGLWLAAGAQVAGANPSTSAITVLANGTTWGRGLIFRSGALTGDASGPATAVAMATNHRLEWYDSNNSVTGFVQSTATTHALPSGLNFTDGSPQFTNAAGYPICTIVNVSSSVNYPQLSASTTGNAPSLAANGSDTNIALALTGKGTGSVNIHGTGTNDNASVGTVGEYQTNTTNTTSLTSTVTANATSVSLTAGDWDVSGVVQFNPAGTTTISLLAAGINTTSATLPGLGAASQTAAAFNGGQGDQMPTPMVRVSLAATTTVFLVASATFGVSTMTVNGFIRARRIR